MRMHNNMMKKQNAFFIRTLLFSFDFGKKIKNKLGTKPGHKKNTHNMRTAEFKNKVSRLAISKVIQTEHQN